MQTEEIKNQYETKKPPDNDMPPKVSNFFGGISFLTVRFLFSLHINLIHCYIVFPAR